MINPKAEELLARLATALDETVVPHITHGPARRQLQAATAVLRRLAYALPRQAAVIAADTADLEKTLDHAVALAGETAPSLSAQQSMEERNLALQTAVADLHVRLPDLKITEATRAQIAALLEDYYRRTVDRDLSLNPPGKDKSDG